jgi:hypothetical protein
MTKRSNLLCRAFLLLPLAATAAMAGPIEYQLPALFQNGLNLSGLGLGSVSLVQFLGESDITLANDGSGNASVTISASEIDGLGFNGTLTGSSTTGEVTPNGDGTFNSFFDVFFEITIPTPVGSATPSGSVVLYNQDALVVADPALSLPVPDGTTFTESVGGSLLTPTSGLNLYVQEGSSPSAGDPLAGQLLAGVDANGGPVAGKTIVPEPGTWMTMAGGLMLAAGFLRRKTS